MVGEDKERIKTYIKGLDEVMENGIPKNYVILVSGRAGTMKSSVSYNILANFAIENNTRGLYLTLEQSSKSIIEHMNKLGIGQGAGDNVSLLDLAKARKSGMIDTSQGDVDWISSILNFLKAYKTQEYFEILVIDSLSAVYVLADLQNPRSDLFNFFEGLRDLNVTTILISEIPAGKPGFGPLGIEEFLADGIIHLKVGEDEMQNLYIGVPKMRKTNHPRRYFPIIFEQGHFEIVVD